ncbi:MAG: metalloregulator ArsR/SmtB family transcription factor [Myxococcales bacterium]|nr:metalloregulator ArsR/SmtB family transcription factor [Myxococcales bacterium]
MLKHAAVDRVFRALGDPTRRSILERISRRPASASELVRPMRVTLAAVVQHLQVLEASGLIRTEKVGRVRSCRVRPEGLEVAERWIAQRRAAWSERFDRPGRILEGRS